MTKTPNKRRKIIWFFTKLTIGILLFALLFSITVGVPIRMELSALEIIVANPEHVAERTITIRGWYRIGLFGREHRFRGSIAISGHPETYGNMQFLQLFNDELRPRFVRSGMLFYEEFVLSGIIYTRPMFLRPMLINMRGADDALDNFNSPIIIVNALSREDALETFFWFFRAIP